MFFPYPPQQVANWKKEQTMMLQHKERLARMDADRKTFMNHLKETRQALYEVNTLSTLCDIILRVFQRLNIFVLTKVIRYYTLKTLGSKSCHTNKSL